MKKFVWIFAIICAALAFSYFDTGESIKNLIPAKQEQMIKDCPLQIGQKTVALGMSEEEVESLFGEACDVLPSEYGFSWNIYHENFKNYVQIGIKDGVVVAMYTNSDGFLVEGIEEGVEKEKVKEKFGEPLNGIVKGSTRFLSNGTDNGENMEIYQIRGGYVTFFYDKLKNNSLTSVNIIDYDAEQGFNVLYAQGSEELRNSFEKQNFYVLNATRAKEGLAAYKPHDGLDALALSHSHDMVENGYFSHYSLNGDSVLERAQSTGIKFKTIGENLAMGAQNSLYLHELLMNSEGHRKNILADFTHVGIGVDFLDNGTPYLTQNFLK